MSTQIKIPASQHGQFADTVFIMREDLDGAQFEHLSSCLETAGQRSEAFCGIQEIPTAFAHPRCGMLLLHTTFEKLPHLIKTIRHAKNRMFDAPVLVLFKDLQGVEVEKLLVPEIDDFLVEPVSTQELCARIHRLTGRFNGRIDEHENVKLRLVNDFGLQQFIGTAPTFISTINKLPRVAACDAMVLLTGETGTGKELCAHAIHHLSRRANRPFIPVNCGTIPPDLFENEMFGHEPEAFTDAHHSKRGLIAEAEGGTLFLDEVDSLPLQNQVKLLRFLQDKQYKPLGSTRYRQSNIRLIAASNSDLSQRIREGALREDLYYRLNIISLSLPPLRDRREDIIPLATHFLNLAAREYSSPIKSFSYGATQKLRAYLWPGNVRELENVVRRAVVLVDGTTIRAHDLAIISKVSAPEAPTRLPLKVAKARLIEAFEQDYLKDLVTACDGNISQAAREAKKNRRAFFALLKKYGLTSTASKMKFQPALNHATLEESGANLSKSLAASAENSTG